jgi:SAM-dependent methyltransferase
MRQDLVPLLCSPDTGNGFRLEVLASEGDEVIEGRLVDVQTGSWFRIEDGIADLAPTKLRRMDKHETFRARHRLDPDRPTEADEPMAKSYAEQIRFFKDYHAQYEEDVVGSPFYRILDNVTLGAWMRRELAMDSLVVEVGCGSGRQTIPMMDHACRVIGADLSEEMLKIARRKATAESHPGRADFIVASADALPLLAEVGDAAVIFGSLHHFADPGAAIKEAARVLKPGGRFYMLEPHDSPLRPLFEWSMKLWTLWREEAADEPLFNETQWRDWLTASGIAPLIRYSTYLPPHVFYAVRGKIGEALLTASDALFGNLPGIRKLGGIIIAEGLRQR